MNDGPQGPTSTYGFDNPREVLAGFANGEVPITVFGPGRPYAAAQLRGILENIAPDDEDRCAAAFSPDTAQISRRVRAYDRGVAYMRAAYWEHAGSFTTV